MHDLIVQDPVRHNLSEFPILINLLFESYFILLFDLLYDLILFYKTY